MDRGSAASFCERDKCRRSRSPRIRSRSRSLSRSQRRTSASGRLNRRVPSTPPPCHAARTIAAASSMQPSMPPPCHAFTARLMLAKRRKISSDLAKEPAKNVKTMRADLRPMPLSTQGARLTQGGVPELVWRQGDRRFTPILQVSRLERFNQPGTSSQPWMMALSDGEQFAVAMVTPARAHIVESPQGVQQYSIVQLFHWQTEVREGARVIFVKDWLHIETRTEPIGLPVRHKA